MSNWRETLERPEMQAMSESHRAWQQQLQQAEMQAQAAAEAQAQRADEPAHGKAGSPEWGTLEDVFGSLRRDEALAKHQMTTASPRWFGVRTEADGAITVNVYEQTKAEPSDTFRLPPDPPSDPVQPVSQAMEAVCRHYGLRMPSDPPQSEQPATDTSAGAVQRRIDDVCQDLVAGRTSDAQRRGLGGAVERAGRIPAGSDAAVGRIARLSR